MSLVTVYSNTYIYIYINLYTYIYKLILRLTPADNLLAVYNYVVFRSKYPAEDAVKDMLKDLQDNNIDVKQLEMSIANHCQPVESSTEGWSSS